MKNFKISKQKNIFKDLWALQVNKLVYRNKIQSFKLKKIK